MELGYGASNLLPRRRYKTPNEQSLLNVYKRLKRIFHNLLLMLRLSHFFIQPTTYKHVIPIRSI
jgi:hypothetical protein